MTTSRRESPELMTRSFPPNALPAAGRRADGRVRLVHDSTAASSPFPEPQPLADAIDDDGDDTPVVAEMRGDPDLQSGVPRTSLGDVIGQIPTDMASQVEEVGDEQDARRALGHASIDAG